MFLNKTSILQSLFVIISFAANAQGLKDDKRHGWPEQKPPEHLILSKPEIKKPEAMLLQSLSGLAAQAVNEGSFNEMVWINVQKDNFKGWVFPPDEFGNDSYEKIYENTIEAINISSIKRMDLWSLVDYLKEKGVIEGFVLYKMDKVRQNPYDSYPDSNNSSNVATVYSSLLKGVLIDESLLKKAESHGLKMLKDARNESLRECFEKNKKQLNPSSALSIPPTVTNMRDYAISHKLMLYTDDKKLIDDVLEWVTPLSPILGWGMGDELYFTRLISSWGHYNTATTVWCWNLPLISSVSNRVKLKKIKEKPLEDINFNEKGSFHSYVLSDGDNMQWTIGSFLDNPAYLGNKNKDEVGLSWTLCPINLSVVSPFTWNSLAEAYDSSFSYIEYGGGYQYPDLFAVNRPNRLELLRKFAKRVNLNIKELGIEIFGFICEDVASKEAQEAYQIYAEELEDITGMLAVQYFPYELDGGIFWKKNKSGIDIPVVTAKYSIWDNTNENRPRAGTPEYISSLINRDALRSQSNDGYQLSWTIVHAWSNFNTSSTLTDEPAKGVNPVMASQNLLVDGIKTVSTNELLWRIRMKYRPEQTKSLLR